MQWRWTETEILHHMHNLQIQIASKFCICAWQIYQASQKRNTVRFASRLKLSNFVFQVKQMTIVHVWSDDPHGISKTEEILIIPTTWPDRAADLLGNIRQWGRTDEERICWSSDIDVKFKGRNTTIGWMKLDRNWLIAANFTNVKMLSNVCFLRDRNFIGNTPDFFLHTRPKLRCTIDVTNRRDIFRNN